MWKLPCLAAAVAALCLASARPAQADAVWSVAGKQVLRMRAAVGGMTPDRRVEELDTRLNNVLSRLDSPLKPSDIVVGRRAGSIVILARGDLLVTVTLQDADANRTTPGKLARAWLTNMRKTLPQLSPRVNPQGA